MSAAEGIALAIVSGPVLWPAVPLSGGRTPDDVVVLIPGVGASLCE